MIRIVGVQRSPNPAQEFVLLQNQGGLRLNLRGHVVMGDCEMHRSEHGEFMHVFRDEVQVPPGAFVLLHTGHGEPIWKRTKEQFMVYYTYMERLHSVWDRCEGPTHVLSLQHSFTERREALLLP